MKYIRYYTLCLLIISLLTCRVVKETQAATINADVTLQGSAGIISKNIWGVDMQSLIYLPPPPMINNFFNTYILASSLQALGAQMYRFPGGCGADSYEWTNGTLVYTDSVGPVNRQYFTVDDAITIANSSNGGEVLYQVNINGTDVASYATANACGEISQVGKDTPTLLVDIQSIASTPQYAQIQYFELGNSQWFNWTPAEYDKQARLFAQSIKATKPTAKIGIVGYPALAAANDPKKIAWDLMIKNLMNVGTCGAASNIACFDFITDHQYPGAKHISPFAGQAAFYPITNLQNQLPRFTANYTGKSYGVTEWNLPCKTPPTNPQMAAADNVDHGIFTFSSLMTMAQSNISIANYHDLSVNLSLGLNYGCGLFSDATTLTAAGQAFQLSSVAAGAELYNIQYAFPQNDGFLQIPANTTCTDTDCLQQGGQNVSILSTYAAKQGNDLYIFLVNRSDAGLGATAATINAIINIPTWPGYDKQVVMDLLAAPTFTARTFQTSNQTIPNQTTAKIQATLLPTSITRIRIVDHFVGAPAATPTPLVRPSNNLTVIQKLVNSKRTTLNKCSRNLYMYIFAAAIYIMFIHFAIAINGDFKMNLLISCFVIGGIVGYYLCHLEIGFVMGIILSLFLW